MFLRLILFTEAFNNCVRPEALSQSLFFNYSQNPWKISVKESVSSKLQTYSMEFYKQNGLFRRYFREFWSKLQNTSFVEPILVTASVFNLSDVGRTRQISKRELFAKIVKAVSYFRKKVRRGSQYAPGCFFSLNSTVTLWSPITATKVETVKHLRWSFLRK